MNTESQVLNVPIEDIIPNRFQPRLSFDETSLQELASSIKEHGIIQPLVLRRLGDKYEIVAGERRYKASKMAGLTSVPAIISTLDDKSSAEVAIVENIQRKDLTSIEEAKSYKALLDKGYLTQEELAKKMGLSQSAISNKLRLLTLSTNVQDALMQGKISERHARSLLQLSNFQDQDEWLKKIIEERLTVRELDKRLKEITGNNTVKEVKEPITNVQEVDKPVEQNNQEEINIVEEPSVENNSNLNESGDIMNNNPEPINNSNLIDNTPIFKTESKPMPNKFFNFLEDEEVNMNTEEEPEEEIELLDFLVPEPANTSLDLTKANELVDNLVSDLKTNSYNVELVKEDNDNQIKYIITINKNNEEQL